MRNLRIQVDYLINVYPFRDTRSASADATIVSPSSLSIRDKTPTYERTIRGLEQWHPRTWLCRDYCNDGAIRKHTFE